MKEFDKLSERQRKILRFIDEYNRRHGFPPAIRDIGEATDTPSTSVVNYNLKKLVEAGYLERESRVSRGVRLIVSLEEIGVTDLATVRPATYRGVRASIRRNTRVPLVGVIAAGEPMMVPEDGAHYVGDEDLIEVTPTLLGSNNPDDVFALRVQGDSMIDAMVGDGDIVLLRRTANAQRGDMVAAWLPDRGETTLKFFYPEGERVRLQPAHPYMDPIYVSPANCQVHGRVIAVIRHVS